MEKRVAVGGGTAGEIGRLSLTVNGNPRDLLRRFEEELHRRSQRLGKEEEEAGKEDGGGVELSLGLSLGGRFGVDPYEKKRLLRSSSIGGLATIPNFDDLIGRRGRGGGVMPLHGQGLARTVSLPVDTEEDLRKRKEMQSLRRLEAKRKRSEKQRNSNCRPAAARKEEEKGGGEEEGSGACTMKFKAPQLPVNGFPASGWRGAAANEKASALVRCEGLAPVSQGSIGSQGSGSSGASDLESGRLLSGKKSNNTGSEVKSPARVHSPPETIEKKAGPTLTGVCGDAERSPSSKNGSKAEESGATTGTETGRSVMEEMPCVSTTGCGPNGRRIEGFLYKYRKGEEVRIVCVCHGSFLSPAEFVKHAGGGDVAHPLRHIVVSPSPPTSMLL